MNQSEQPVLNEQGEPIVINAQGSDISIDANGNIFAGSGIGNQNQFLRRKFYTQD